MPIKTLKRDGEVMTNSPGEITETIKDYFAGIGQKIQPAIPVTTNTSKSLLSSNHSFWVYPVTDDEVESIINIFENETSSGCDEISNEMIKSCAPTLCPHPVKLVNISFTQGCFPCRMKEAKAIPLHKGGPRNETNNYRPVSLLNTKSKIFERAMYNRITFPVSRKTFSFIEESNKSTAQ